MILARISQHLRRQDWTAIAIEFVIVVSGVFIGMQVSNWNAEQADVRLGRVYTARLAEDLQKDLIAHRAVRDYYRQVLASVERTNALLRDSAADAKDLVKHAYRASELVNAPRTRATWDEIVSSGDTGLLPRAALESGLADYFAGNAMRDVYERMGALPYRTRLRSIVPLAVQKAIRAACSDVVIGSARTFGFVPDCQIAVDDHTLRATAAALRADLQLATDLNLQYSNLVSTLGMLANSIQDLERALAALGHPTDDSNETGT